MFCLRQSQADAGAALNSFRKGTRKHRSINERYMEAVLEFQDWCEHSRPRRRFLIEGRLALQQYMDACREQEKRARRPDDEEPIDRSAHGGGAGRTAV